MRDAPVGRAAEWERLVARLEARKSALVLVAGLPGSGRTHLVGAACTVAGQLGYTVIGHDGEVTLEPTTKTSDVRRIVASLLGNDAETQPQGEGQAPGFLRGVTAAIFKPTDDARAVSQLLQTAAPAVLVVDGYAPSSAVSTWFGGVLMPRLLKSEAPVVVFVADARESMSGLQAKAADIIELGPLDRDSVAAHLRATGAGLQPALTDDEVAAYCDAIDHDLGVLAPLQEVLSVLGTEQQ